MLFSTNPHITGGAVNPLSELSESMDISEASLNELAVNSGSSPMLSGTELINHILGPINQAESKIYDTASVAMASPLDPASSVELQRSFVEYTKNLTIAAKCVKFASEFVKETTHIQ